MTLSVLTGVVLSALLLIAVRPVQAQTEKVLYSFQGYPGDGYQTLAGLVFDTKGNLYGTTSLGGTYGGGTVFELTSTGIEKVLHSFGGQSGDGAFLYAGLVFGKKGILYGTTAGGGAYADGTVFEVTTVGKKAGTEKVLYSFGGYSGDGINPEAGLVFDKAGNLYGTTYYGGDFSCGPPFGCGTVFEITAAGTETVLYTFGGQPGDGVNPDAGLVLDKAGNLYGTTGAGGEYGYGTVFEITAADTEKVLYSFGSQSGDGFYPLAGLVFGKKGNLYGTTSGGGGPGCYGFGCGTVFEITAAGKEKVLYSFGSQSGDGGQPTGLVFDTQGNLYGTTTSYGAYGYGTVFEITATGKEKVLYSFGSQSGDGYNPPAGLVLDKEGNLYGTTVQGGAYGYGNGGNGYGTVFEVTP